MKCENCSHAEMCRWIDELEGRGCDFFDGEQEPCGNCEIVQASINTGIRTASRLVDDVLDKITLDINKAIDDCDSIYSTSALHKALEIIDKYR